MSTRMHQNPIKVLDHGYVQFIEAGGHGLAGESYEIRNSVNENEWVPDDNECGIVEAARQSTQGSFRGWEEDEKLLKSLYLSEPQHSTPFEFADATIEVYAPIMVFREWHRHRTFAFNEMSGRYAPLPDVNYLPDWEVLKARGEAAEKSRNKQEKGTHPWNPEKAVDWLEYALPNCYSQCQAVYEMALEAGVPKEMARLTVPVGRYSKMRAKSNLRNWLAFMTLRHDPQAQWEIRQYAAIVGEILKTEFPRTWALYVEKKSPEHRIKKFTDDQLRAECLRRGLGVNCNSEEVS